MAAGAGARSTVVTQHVSKHSATLLMTIFINMDYLAANALIRICLLSLFPVCTCLIYYNKGNINNNSSGNIVSCFLICHTLKANEHHSSCPSPLAKTSPQALRAAVEHKGYGNITATQRHGDTEAHATCGNYENCCQSR